MWHWLMFLMRGSSHIWSLLISFESNIEIFVKLWILYLFNKITRPDDNWRKISRINHHSYMMSTNCGMEQEQEKKSYLEKWIQLATDSMFGWVNTIVKFLCLTSNISYVSKTVTLNWSWSFFKALALILSLC